MVAVTAAGVPGAAAAPTRYLDPLFAGALAPVVHASYDPTTALDREQVLSVLGMTGTFTLGFAGQTTVELPVTASAATVDAALDALATVDLDGTPGDDVTVTGGPGGWLGGNLYRIRFEDEPSIGAYAPLTATDVSLTGLVHEARVQCARCLDVYRPDEPTPPAGGRPVVLLLHSGGFTGGSKDAASGDGGGIRMQQWATDFAARGYVAVPINYALADADDLAMLTTCDWDATSGPPCPQAWLDAATAARHDAAAAIRWLRWTALDVGAGGLGNPYGIDPTRIVALGESAGAVIALDLLYRSDDPGTVGITQGSSSVQAAVAIAGFANDAQQDAGEGPALLLTYTTDPTAEIFDGDMYDEAREVVARANAVGNVVELASYPGSADTNGDTLPDGLHLAALASADFADMVERSVRFAFDRVVAAAPPAGPSPVTWFGATSGPPFSAASGQILAGTHQPVTGDFDGDGRTDILWYAPGATADTAWFGSADRTFVDPRESFSGTFTPAFDLGGDFEATTGDFDGDGRTDLVWYDPATGAGTAVWYGNADRTFAEFDVGAAPIGLDIVAGDFDGDGIDDLFLYLGSVPGGLVLHGSAVRMSFTTGGTWPMDPALDAVAGDFDGDGTTDLLWYTPTTSSIWFGNAAGPDAFTPAGGGTPPAGAPRAGDFDGDDHDDVFWVSSPGVSSVQYGPAARGPLVPGRSWSFPSGLAAAVGDVNGNGRDDLVLTSQTGGANWVWYGTANRIVLPFVAVSLPAISLAARPAVVGNFDGDSSGSGKPVDDVHWAGG